MSNCPRFAIARWICIVVVSLLLVSTSGCGKKQQPVVPVSGTVLYNGKPLDSGSVVFQPKDGPPAHSKIQQDGTFRLSTHRDGDGAVLGEHAVQITCYEPPPTGQIETPLGKSRIPRKYTSYETSGLKANVKPANEPLVFELRD